MNKRVFNNILLSGILICSMCACSKNGENTPKTAQLGSTDLTYTENHVSGTLCEGVTVDADIPDLSAVTSYDIVSAHLQLPDDDVIQSMKDYLFDGYPEDKIMQEYIEDDQSTTFYIEGTATQKARFLSMSDYPGAQSVFLYNFEAYPHERLTYEPALPMGGTTLSQFTTQIDLSFMSQKDAVDAVKRQLNEWNIQTIGDPLLICMDGEEMYKLLTKWNEVGIDDNPLQEESIDELDCYYMIFDVGYHNIPYTCFEFGSPSKGTFTYGARVKVHFTAKGIVQLEYSWADYSIDSVQEKHNSIITLDQAMSQIKKQYEKVIATSELHIPNIYFQYVPINPDEYTGNCTLVPAWVIQPAINISQNGETIEDYLHCIVVHAITGEILTGI